MTRFALALALVATTSAHAGSPPPWLESEAARTALELVAVQATVGQLTRRALMAPVALGEDAHLPPPFDVCARQDHITDPEWIVGPYREGWAYRLDLSGCPVGTGEEVYGQLVYTAAPLDDLHRDASRREVRRASLAAGGGLRAGTMDAFFELDVATESGTWITAHGDASGNDRLYAVECSMEAFFPREDEAWVPTGAPDVQAHWSGQSFHHLSIGLVSRGVLFNHGPVGIGPLQYRRVVQPEVALLPSRGVVRWIDDVDATRLRFLDDTPVHGEVEVGSSRGDEYVIPLPEL